MARRIGDHLVKKLKKNLSKHLRLQLSSLEQNDANDYTVSEVSQPDHKPYTQLKSLARGEKTSANSESQDFFELLVSLG